MSRRDWLLLLLAFKGADGAALDPVRVQKGMFLFAEEGGAPREESYEFRPYNYGPYSFDLRDDLDQLVHEGLVSAEEVPGYTWNRYRATKQGKAEAEGMRDRADRTLATRLFDVKQQITEQSFNTLLRDVYDRYPAYATNSIFRR